MRRVGPSAIMEILKRTAGRSYISFASGLPDPALYPVDTLRELASDVLEADGRMALQYGPAEGHAPLREWVAGMLRARGLPARARCGFGAYFAPPRFEDHWVCEVWDESRGAWRLVDAQLDAVQREALGIAFDPLDVPRAQFLVAGDAWQRCRSGRADPQDFGILDLRGLWFVRGNVVRDLAARAKRELLPWDGWGLMLERDRQSDPAELALLDRVAEVTQAGDERHAEVLTLHDSEPGLRVPRVIVSLGPGGDAKIDLGPRVAD